MSVLLILESQSRAAEHVLQTATEPEPEPEEPELLEDLRGVEDLERFLDRIPPIEADLLELLVRRGKTQGDIAVVLDMTQGGVSYRLARAVERVRYARWLDSLGLDRETVVEAARAVGMRSAAETVGMIWELGGGVAVARARGVRQSSVTYAWATFRRRILATTGDELAVVRAWVAGHKWNALIEGTGAPRRARGLTEQHREHRDHRPSTIDTARAEAYVREHPGVTVGDAARALGIHAENAVNWLRWIRHRVMTGRYRREGWGMRARVWSNCGRESMVGECGDCGGPGV